MGRSTEEGADNYIFIYKTGHNRRWQRSAWRTSINILKVIIQGRCEKCIQTFTREVWSEDIIGRFTYMWVEYTDELLKFTRVHTHTHAHAHTHTHTYTWLIWWCFHQLRWFSIKWQHNSKKWTVKDVERVMT